VQLPLVRLSLVTIVALAITGAVWASSLVAVKERAELKPADLKRQLKDYQKRIAFHAHQEYWALVQADEEAMATASNRKQLEHIRQFGGPPLWEHWTGEMKRTAQEAAASRKRAAEHGRKRRELEEAYYSLWESAPPDTWESIRLSPSRVP